MEAHIFKVSLFYAKRTYRKIAIQGNQTLGNLHKTIFSAFDRYDDGHMYCFYFPDHKTQSLNTIGKSEKFVDPFLLDDFKFEDEFSLEPKGCYDASNTKINTLQLKEKQKFYYLFDFGDEWWHEITYEGIKDLDKDQYPKVIMKKGESPEQYPDYDEEDDY